MKLANKLGLFVALALVAVSSREAAAMNWSVGANLGYTMVMPASKYTNAENLNYFAWPNGGFAPGMRFGFTGENPTHEVFIDTGLRLFSTKDFSARDLILTGNYQYNFSSGGSTAPFVTAGAGFALTGSKDETVPASIVDESATSIMIGGGVGMRHKMGNGGTMRGEVRFDRLGEGKDGTSILLPEANMISVRLGFDLWGK